MKLSFVLSEQGVCNIYFVRDERPRIQWLIDLGVPNFTAFMLELPIPEDNPAHVQIIFHEGTALLLQQIRAFLSDSDFGRDGGVIQSIMDSIHKIEIDFASTEAFYGYEILFPLTSEFYQLVQERLVKQKVAASREEEISRAVWRGPDTSKRVVIQPWEKGMVQKKDKQQLQDAKRIIDRYKQTLYKNTPGPLYVILYDRNGMPRGVTRVTNRGMTKWAAELEKQADEFAKPPKQLLKVLPDIHEVVPDPDDEDSRWPKPNQFKQWDRVNLLRQRSGLPLPTLGEGSSRVVLAVNDGVVLKLARNSAGVAQNRAEYAAYEKVEDCSIIARIFYYDEDFHWLLSERILRKPGDEDWEMYGASGPSGFVHSCLASEDSKWYQQVYAKDPIAVESLKYLVNTLGADKNDMESNVQWGVVERDGEQYPVLVDYGLTHEVWNRYYGSLKKTAGEKWAAWWITPDGRVVDVPDNAEHWEVVADELGGYQDEDPENPPQDALYDAIYQGWIRCCHDGKDAYFELAKLTRENLHKIQATLSGIGGIRTVVIEEDPTGELRRSADVPFDEFMVLNKPEPIWRMQRVAAVTELPHKLEIKLPLNILTELESQAHRLDPAAQFRFVGGCVRDMLLGRKPKDIDIVTNTSAEVLQEMGLENVGKAFPVYLYHDDTYGQIEIAVARAEEKTGIGHKGFDVTPTGNFDDDVVRRDLNINAMMVDAHGKLYGPEQALENIQSRTLSNVSEKFAEDPLRVFRVARFAAQFGADWKVSPELNDLMGRMQGELASLPADRIREETRRALNGKNPLNFFEVLRNANCLDPWFSEIHSNWDGMVVSVQYGAEHHWGFEQQMVGLASQLDSPDSLINRLGLSEQIRRATQYVKQNRHKLENARALPKEQVVELVQKGWRGILSFDQVLDCALVGGRPQTAQFLLECAERMRAADMTGVKGKQDATERLVQAISKTGSMEDLQEIIKIQTSDGNWNYDPYMHGLANGMILSEATVLDQDPEFLEAPEEWLADKTANGPADPDQDYCDRCDSPFPFGTEHTCPGGRNVNRINPGTKPEAPKPSAPTPEPVEPDTRPEPTAFETHKGYQPRKTVKAYKLFRVDPKRPGKLFPLFVDSNTPIPMGVWVDAKAGELTSGGKVKSKLGPLTYRPGWHGGDIPLATHIGDYSPEQKAARAKVDALRAKAMAEQGVSPKGKADKARRTAINKQFPYPDWAVNPTLRPPNQVWAEVEMAADVDWQTEAQKRTQYTKKNTPKPGTSHITDQVPFGGYYRYKTNPNMTGEWMIGGNMKIVRLLTDAEVEAVNAKAGTADLPRLQPVDITRFGFTPQGRPKAASLLVRATEDDDYAEELQMDDARWYPVFPDEDDTEPGAKWEPIRRTAMSVTEAVEEATEQVQQELASRPKPWETPAFKAWFGDSKVVNPDGSPKRVLHGTTHEFEQFSDSNANEENWYGRGHYFTDCPQDVSENYADISGPDLTNRIEQLAERLMDEGGDWEEEAEVDPDEDTSWGTEAHKKIREAALAAARKMLAGRSRGHVIPVFLKMENPVIVSAQGGTYFESDSGYNNPDDEDDYTEGENDTRFYQAWEQAFADAWKPESVWDEVYQELVDGSLTAYKFEQAVRSSDMLSDEGGPGPAISLFYDLMGFDGIIMDANAAFKNMKMSPGTRHYVVWNPKQIKSATGNKGTWDPSSALLTAAVETAPEAPPASTTPLTPPGHLPHYRVSPRLPKQSPGGKGKPREDSLAEKRLQPGLDIMKQDEKKLKKNIDLVRKYPNFPRLNSKAHKAADEVIEHMADNLVWLFEEWKEHRDRSKLWYVGGNALIHRWSKKFDLDPHQVAGVLAAMSPERPWFGNVTLAERFLVAMQNINDLTWDAPMSRILDTLNDKQQAARQNVEGKTLAEVSGTSEEDMWNMTLWIKCWDLAHNPRGCRVLTPEGDFGDVWRNDNGRVETANVWKYFDHVIKSIKILRTKSLEDISNIIGQNHKVRSFYNNLIAPFDEEDVTIDTHAVAAALLRPLGTSDIEVTHNFGGAGTGDSAITGSTGLYGLYAEAYRRAAQRTGVLPRELQSITWEAVRALFKSSLKRSIKEQANAVWLAYTRGEADVNATRLKIKELGGGFDRPTWHGSDPANPSETGDSSYQGKLSSLIHSRRQSGRVSGSRNRSRFAPGLAVSTARSGLLRTAALKFTTWTRGAHHGQTDATLAAYAGNMMVGIVDYVVYGGEVIVQGLRWGNDLLDRLRDTDLLSRGTHGKSQQLLQHVRTQLLKELQKLYPDYEIEFSNEEEYGYEYDSVPSDHAEDFARLEEMKKRRQELAKTVHDESGEDIIDSPNWDAYYDIERDIEVLEQDLYNKRPTKHLIRT